MAGVHRGVTYRLCPRCGRALPSVSEERYCPHDGARLIGHCPGCHADITSPYARYCTRCGQELVVHGGHSI
ncbi:putative amidophosphoribosyltransferase [Deinococcus metalli]|uniref:Putative amidophosphoribosyltransferase n=1 Tax=Deinococcus metalli TaxID=1141878 RepID=A0A7W8KFJ0_9DEIO|nr:putative amidophosphoribosyltransferase [Deinococcus metalli]